MSTTSRPTRDEQQDDPRWSPSGDRDHHRRTGELTAWEFLRWVWRLVTSMRTALVLLLLLALGAIPGSVIPQEGVDALKTQNWQAAHPHLTPIYDRLGLFSVYHSAWFAAIYLLLMISLVGCIVPRLFVYWRGPPPLLARVPLALVVPPGGLPRPRVFLLRAGLPPAAPPPPAHPPPPARPRVVHHRGGAGRRARPRRAAPRQAQPGLGR